MNSIFIVLIAIILLAGCIFWVGYVYSIASFFDEGAPFVPITKKVLKDIFNLAEIKDNSVFYDLGCGDGRVLNFGSHLNKKAKFIGIEKQFVPLLLAKFVNRKNANVNIINRNIFKCNLSDATHVYVYLFPSLLQKLLPKFRSELRPGALVISSDFELEGLEPIRVIKTGLVEGLGGIIYLYKF